MSYSTSVDGHIEFDPPMNWAEIRGSAFRAASGDDAHESGLHLVVDETHPFDTDAGVITIRDARRLEVFDGTTQDDEVLSEALEQFLAAHGDGRTFTGWFEGDGEESEDLWRLWVGEGPEVKLAHPEMTWPAGPWNVVGGAGGPN